jgi:hypothetical protein
MDPGAKTANAPSPAGAAEPVSPVVPLPGPVNPAESQPAEATTSSTVDPGTATGGATAGSPGSEVRSANQVLDESPAAPVRRSRQLGETGDGTRRLVIFGGFALLVGAVVVAFTGRERSVALAAAVPSGPARRPRPRKELDGWEDGIPLAPVKRELARHRLGISAGPYYDDEPGA